MYYISSLFHVVTSSIITLIARCWLLLCSSDCLERKDYRPLQVLHVTQSSTMTSHTADDSDDVIVLDSSDSRHHAHGRKSHGNCDVSGLLCGYFFKHIRAYVCVNSLSSCSVPLPVIIATIIIGNIYSFTLHVQRRVLQLSL